MSWIALLKGVKTVARVVIGRLKCMTGEHVAFWPEKEANEAPAMVFTAIGKQPMVMNSCTRCGFVYVTPWLNAPVAPLDVEVTFEPPLLPSVRN